MLDAFLSRKGRAIAWPERGILQQAADAKGKGIDATIGIAVEDDGTPMHLSANRGSLSPERAFPYAPGFGVRELREAWLAELRRKNPSLTAPTTLPAVTAGLTHGLAVASHLFLDQGDRIILPDLFWGNYRLIFCHLHDAELATFPMFDGGAFNVEGLRAALRAPGKKVLLLNFPNNPTGYTPTVTESTAILDAVREAAESGDRLVVILDDAYFGLVYEEGVARESLFARLAALHPNVLAVKVDGATKEEFAWGFRIGFLTYAGKGLSDEERVSLEKKTAAVVRATVSNCSHIAQSMLVDTLKGASHEKEKEEKHLLLKRRYERVKRLVADERRVSFRPLPFNSGYFLCIKLRDGLDAERVRQKLLAEHDVGVIALPGNLLRIAYSGVPERRLEELFDRIEKACSE